MLQARALSHPRSRRGPPACLSRRPWSPRVQQNPQPRVGPRTLPSSQPTAARIRRGGRCHPARDMRDGLCLLAAHLELLATHSRLPSSLWKQRRCSPVTADTVGGDGVGGSPASSLVMKAVLGLSGPLGPNGGRAADTTREISRCR